MLSRFSEHVEKTCDTTYLNFVVNKIVQKELMYISSFDNSFVF